MKGWSEAGKGGKKQKEETASPRKDRKTKWRKTEWRKGKMTTKQSWKMPAETLGQRALTERLGAFVEIIIIILILNVTHQFFFLFK